MDIPESLTVHVEGMEGNMEPLLRLYLHLKDGRTLIGTYPQREGLSRLAIAQDSPDFKDYDMGSVRND